MTADGRGARLPQAQAEEAVLEEIRDSRKSMEQERVAHLPPQKNAVLESVLKVATFPCRSHAQ